MKDTDVKTILAVDDNPVILELITSALKDYNYSIYTVENGEKGYELATAILPDLIILDVMMPYIDGFMTCKMLRQNDKTKDIPIIFLTAKPTSNPQKILSSTKADLFMTKPFSPNELALKVSQLLDTAEG